MCPLRVLLIMLSAIIALIAVMYAMAKDPTEEDLEEERLRKEERAKMSTFAVIVDVVSLKWLWRHLTFAWGEMRGYYARLRPYVFPASNECDAEHALGEQVEGESEPRKPQLDQQPSDEAQPGAADADAHSQANSSASRSSQDASEMRRRQVAALVEAAS